MLLNAVLLLGQQRLLQWQLLACWANNKGLLHVTSSWVGHTLEYQTGPT